MSHRNVLFVGVFAVAVIAGCVASRKHESKPAPAAPAAPAAPPTPTPTSAPERASAPTVPFAPLVLRDPTMGELTQIRQAEAVDDPLQRCLAFPDPPGAHWDKALVVARCRYMYQKVPTLADMEALLDAGHAAKLDAMFSGFQRNNATLKKRGILHRAMNSAFEAWTPQAEEVVTHWRKARPNSPHAYTASAQLKIAQAWAARGSAPSGQTSSLSMERFEALLTDAQADLQAALARDPKHSHALLKMISVALGLGDRDRLEAAAHKALSLDPADDVIYETWIGARRPRWGGSDAEVAEAIAIADAHVKENVLLKLVHVEAVCCDGARHTDLVSRAGEFESIVAAAPATYALRLAGDAWRDAAQRTTPVSSPSQMKAMWFYSESLRFRPDAPVLLDRYRLLQSMHRNDWADESLRAAERMNQTDALALYALAGVYADQHRTDDAIRCYRQILKVNPHHREATMGLIVHIAHMPGHEQEARDVAEAAVKVFPLDADMWLVVAEATDNDRPRQREALQHFLDVVDRSDAARRRQIERAQQRLATIAADGSGH